jgi:hypothetical protein
MSDPSEASQANPHPISGHRTPSQIAKDEAGPAGPKPAEAGPTGHEPKRADKEIHDAVQRGAHAAKSSIKHPSAVSALFHDRALRSEASGVNQRMRRVR